MVLRSQAGSEPEADMAAWWMIAVLLACYVLSMTDRLMVTMLVDPIRASLDLTDFEVSVILGPAFAVPYALASVPFGWLTDRFSRRGVFLSGMLAWSAAMVASGLSQSYAALLGSRVALGIGEAAAAPASYSLIADRFPTRRLTTALAVYGMGPKLGTSVAFAGGGMLIAYTSGLGDITLGSMTLTPWQVTLILAGMPGFALALALLSFREPSRRAMAANIDVEDHERLLPFLARHRGLYGPIFVGFGAVGIAANALAFWVPTYMSRDFGLSPAQYGPALGLISLLSAGTLLFKGYAVDWLFARGWRDIHLRLFLWLLIGAIPITAIAFLVRDPWTFLILYGVVNVVALSYLVYSSAILQITTPPRMRGRMNGVLVLANSALPSAIAAPLVGGLSDFAFHDSQGLRWSLALASVAAMTAGALILWPALARIRAALDTSA